MNEFMRKKLAGICTWSGCSEKGEYSDTDVDEPSGEKLLHCQAHHRKYMTQLDEELERLPLRLRGDDEWL
jgi:hypothetical protein